MPGTRPGMTSEGSVADNFRDEELLAASSPI